MLKNILNLKGAQQLNKNEQKNVFGGFGPVSSNSNCSSDCDCFSSHGTLFICQDFTGGIGALKRCVNGFSKIDPFTCPGF